MIISVGKIRVTIYNRDKLMWYKRASHFGIFVTLHVTFYIFLSGKIRESFIALLIYTCAVYLRAINVSFRIIFFSRLLTTCIESSHEDYDSLSICALHNRKKNPKILFLSIILFCQLFDRLLVSYRLNIHYTHFTTLIIILKSSPANYKPLFSE